MLASAQIAAEPVLPLAAFPLLAQKPHQGVASRKPALHQGQLACNSTTALGLSWSWRSGTASGAGVTYDYDAWGNAVNVTGSTPNLYRYRGEQYDPDLNLYYLRARYFNPLTGRFLTRDPMANCGCTGCMMNPSRLHRYLYAGGNPVNLRDPRGLEEEVDYSLIIGSTTMLFAAAAYWEYKTGYFGGVVRGFWYIIDKKMKCGAKLLEDMKNCEEAYPNDPAAYKACVDAAVAAFRQCMGIDTQ